MMDNARQRAIEALAMSVVQAWEAYGRGLSDPEQMEEAKSQAYEALLSLHDGSIPSVLVDSDTEVVFKEPNSQGVRAIIQRKDGWQQHEQVFRLPGATGTITDARELAEHLSEIWRSAAQYQQAGNMAAWKSEMDRAVEAEKELVAFVREHEDTLRGPEHKVRAVRRWLKKGRPENIRRLVDDLLLDPASGR